MPTVLDPSTYYARRWRSLSTPITQRAPRAALAPVFTAAPTGIYTGLPRAAARNPRTAALLVPLVAAAGAGFYIRRAIDGVNGEMGNVQEQEQEQERERQRRRALADAYGGRDSLERLEEAARVYEANRS